MWLLQSYNQYSDSSHVVVMLLLQSYSQFSDSSHVVVMWWSCGYYKVIFLIEEKYKTRGSNISFIDLLLDRSFLNSIFLDAFLQKSVCERAAVRVPICTG